jgi:hypothetical protein
MDSYLQLTTIVAFVSLIFFFCSLLEKKKSAAPEPAGAWPCQLLAPDLFIA